MSHPLIEERSRPRRVGAGCRGNPVYSEVGSMRYRVVFVIGLAIGYVLGSRAGRERYEQIKRLAQRVADNPKIQEAAGLVGARASRIVATPRWTT